MYPPPPKSKGGSLKTLDLGPESGVIHVFERPQWIFFQTTTLFQSLIETLSTLEKSIFKGLTMLHSIE